MIPPVGKTTAKEVIAMVLFLMGIVFPVYIQIALHIIRIAFATGNPLLVAVALAVAY